jgi:hypothetical protein
MNNKKINNRNSVNGFTGKNNNSNKLNNVSSSINSSNIDKKNNISGQIVKNGEPTIEFDRMAHLTLGDLPEEEKAKISRLVEKLVSLGHEKDELVEKLNNDKILYDEEINEIKSDYSNKFEQLINKTNLYEKNSKDLQSNVDKYQYELLNKQKELDNYQSKVTSTTNLLKLYQIKIKELDDKLKLIEKEKSLNQLKIPNLDTHIKQMEDLINSQTLTIQSSQESLEIMRNNFEKSEIKVDELNSKLQETSKKCSIIDSSYRKLELGCLDLTKQLTNRNKICVDKEQLCIQLENKLFLKDKHIKELDDRFNSLNINSEQKSLNNDLKYSSDNNNNNNNEMFLNKTNENDNDSVDSERYSVNRDIFTPTPPQSPTNKKQQYIFENNDNQFQVMFLNESTPVKGTTSPHTSISSPFINKDVPKSSPIRMRKSNEEQFQTVSLSPPKFRLSQSIDVKSTESLTNLKNNKKNKKTTSNSTPRYSQELIDDDNDDDNNDENHEKSNHNHISSPHVKFYATNKSTSMSPIYQNNTTIGSLPWEETVSKIDNTQDNYKKSLHNNQQELKLDKKKKGIKEKKIKTLKNNEKSDRLKNNNNNKDDIIIKRTNKTITNSKTNTRNLGPNPNGFFSFKKSELHESIDNNSNFKKTIGKINQRKSNDNMKIPFHQSLHVGINGDYDSILFDLLDDLNLVDNNSL